MTDIIQTGDRVTIPKYSELFGSHNSDPVVDRRMATVVFKVVEKEEVYVTDGVNGPQIVGFGMIELVEEDTGEELDLLITTHQVKKVL